MSHKTLQNSALPTAAAEAALAAVPAASTVAQETALVERVVAPEQADRHAYDDDNNFGERLTLPFCSVSEHPILDERRRTVVRPGPSAPPAVLHLAQYSLRARSRTALPNLFAEARVFAQRLI